MTVIRVRSSLAGQDSGGALLAEIAAAHGVLGACGLAPI